MSTEQPGRPDRTTANTSPMGSTIAIVVAIVAVLGGFLIMRSIRDTDGSSSGTPATTIPTIDPGASTTVASAVTTTTAFVPTFVGTKVQVANSAKVGGAAKTLSTALAGQSFQMADPVDGTTELDITKVLYNPSDPAAAAVAQTVASVLRITEPIEPAVDSLPTSAGTWPDGTGVLVLLGKDKAGKTLEQIAGGSTVGANTTTTAG